MPSRVFEILDSTAEIHPIKVLRVINLLICSEFAQSQFASSCPADSSWNLQ